MKCKMLLSFAALTCLSTGLFSQQVSKYAGTWEGVLSVGVELKIVFHIHDDGKGSLQATADSPDQAAFDMKCDTAFVSDKGITIELRNLHASYTGRLINDSTLDGTFTQGASFPLSLKKVDKPSERKRPQTPQPPFPYDSYDLEYDNADQSVHFGATLTVPKPDTNIKYIKAPQYPVAVLITGSGQQDRDETILGHKPFAVIADHLSRKGFAVLRIDDRGTGKTTGDLLHATSADFAKDIEAGIDFLRTRTDIDKNKIGLIGHSEGGMIAPVVATERKDINFIILLAGPGIKIIDLMAEQNAAILRSTGINEQVINDFIPLYKKVATTIAKGKDSVTSKNKALNIVTKWAKKTSAETKELLGLPGINEQQRYINELFPVLSTPWFRYFLLFDPQPYLEQLDCKVLALNGSRDIQVISASNLAGIEKSLKKSRVPVFETKEMPGLNHLFQHCTKCTVAEYGQLEETFSPEVLTIMSDWLIKNVK